MNAVEEIKSVYKTVRVAQVIITTNAQRGDGTKGNPLRQITQVWSMDGDLIAENDPALPLLSPPRHTPTSN